MKKSVGVIGGLVIVGVAYAATSWYVGRQAQTTIEHAVEQINERLVSVLGTDLGGIGLKATIGSYRRHVFSSDVTYTVQMKDDDGAPIDLVFTDHLQHGPFPLGALRSGDFTPMLALSTTQLVASGTTQKWFDSLDGESPVVAVNKVGFSGSGESTWEFKPFELEDDGDTLKFDGGDMAIKFSNDFKDNTAMGRLGSFGMVTPATGEDLQVKGLKLDSKTVTSDEGNVKVRSTATIDAVSTSSAGTEPVRLEKMVIDLDTLQQGNLLGGSLRYDFGRVAVGKADLGSLSVGLKGRQLDVVALAALATEYDAIRIKHGLPDDADFELTDAEAAIMRAKLGGVLAANPSLSLDPMVWKNDKGESSAALEIDLTGAVRAQTLENESADELLARILKRVRLDFSISRPMFVQAFVQVQGDASHNDGSRELAGSVFDQYADRLGKTGLAVIDNDKAVTAILYENGTIQANGKKMTVTEFMQRVIAAAM